MPPTGTFRRIPDPTIIKKPTTPVVIEEPLDSESMFEEPEVQDRRPSTLATPEQPVNRYRAFLWPVATLLIGLVVLWFGIFNAGGFYEQGSRLSGDLARFFYVLQVGNLLEIIGVLVVWESLKRVKSLL